MRTATSCAEFGRIARYTLAMTLVCDLAAAAEDTDPLEWLTGWLATPYFVKSEHGRSRPQRLAERTEMGLLRMSRRERDEAEARERTVYVAQLARIQADARRHEAMLDEAERDFAAEDTESRPSARPSLR